MQSILNMSAPRSGKLYKEKAPRAECFFWLRGLDLNQRPSGYEPDELPAAPPRDIQLNSTNILYTKAADNATLFSKKI